MMKLLIRMPGWAQMATIGGLALSVAMVISAFCPPAPRVHDEFSNLLAADTLLNGRLGNPTPAVWEPLQTFHVILQPGYASKYPIGNGALVALGWIAAGTPHAGPWLGAAAVSMACFWMLVGLLPRRFALLGGALVALHPALQPFWSQSLLNGWLPALGSALLTGGVIRLRRQVRPTPAVIAGFGVAVLALSRPFEGLICTVACALVLWGAWCRHDWQRQLQLIAKAARWSAGPVAAALVVIGFHNHATTGSWQRMPYQIHEEQYAVAPVFVLQHRKTPEFEKTQPQVVRDFHLGWSLDSYESRQGWIGMASGARKSVSFFSSFWMTLGVLPVLTVVGWAQFRFARWLAIAVGIQILAASTVCWVFPHYLAPILPWLLVLSIMGLRRGGRLFQRLEGRRKYYQFAAGSLVAVQLLWMVPAVAALPSHPAREWSLRRAEIQQRFDAGVGRHLILVHYDEHHIVHQEWVYNGANPEMAKVVWAHDERPDWTKDLLGHYGPGRFVWRLHPDKPGAPMELLQSP